MKARYLGMNYRNVQGYMIDLNRLQENQTVDYQVNATREVNQSKEEIEQMGILGISITKAPTTTRYYEGETEADLSGGELSIVFKNGSTKTIPMVDDMESTIHDGKVIVRCFGKTAKFPVYITKAGGEFGKSQGSTVNNQEEPFTEKSYDRFLAKMHTEEKKKQEPQVIYHGQYPYVRAEWVFSPFYSNTEELRFVDDKELEDIFDDNI